MLTGRQFGDWLELSTDLIKKPLGGVGRTDAVRGRFYAISVERRLKHPAGVAICETARRELFAKR